MQELAGSYLRDRRTIFGGSSGGVFNRHFSNSQVDGGELPSQDAWRGVFHISFPR